MRTRSQEYANAVYEQVSEIDQQYDEKDPVKKKFRKQYGSMAHKLPVLVRTAGLAQALAYVEARGKEAHQELLNHLTDTLQQTSAFDIKKGSLAKQSREADIGEYMHLSEQVITALLWYKRFAQSVLKVEAGEDKEDKNE